MKLPREDSWKRRGMTILWDPGTLADTIDPAAVCSMRDLFALPQRWPEDLPGAGGDALVVAGLEGCLDILDEEDAIAWLEHDLRGVILDFQNHYQSQAALIFWLPNGRNRLVYHSTDSSYRWRLHHGRDEPALPLGRSLWGGAEDDAVRLLRQGAKNADDADAWLGLYHPRIS